MESNYGAIILLSSGMTETPRRRSGWKPDLDANMRAVATSELYHAHEGEKPDVLICGGDMLGKYPLPLSEILKEELLRRHGIEFDKIFTESSSIDTTQNIKRAKRMVELYGIEGERALVTNSYHLQRAYEVAYKLNFEIEPISTEYLLGRRALRRQANSPTGSRQLKEFLDEYEDSQSTRKKEELSDRIMKVLRLPFGERIATELVRAQLLKQKLLK